MVFHAYSILFYFIFSIYTVDVPMGLDLRTPGRGMHPMYVDEKVPPAFYCTGGCGGNLLSQSNHEFWQFGTCIMQDTCA